MGQEPRYGKSFLIQKELRERKLHLRRVEEIGKVIGMGFEI